VDAGRVRELFAHRKIWAHLGGITLWQVFYFTIQIFGPTILVQTFGITSSRAATITAISWAINLATLYGAGWLSDRLQLRKPLILAGALGGLVGIGYLVRLIGSGEATPVQLVAINAVIGAALAVTFTPWMALYSEDVEDIRPDLQATAWGLFGLSIRFMILIMLISAPVVTEAAGGSWQRWLLIALICNAAMVPAVFLFGGPWRRTRPTSSTALSALRTS